MSNNDKAGTVLAAVDSSHNSLLAAGVGARMARLLDAHLGLIHVLDLPTQSFWGHVEARMKDEIRAEAERQLSEIAAKMHSVCVMLPELYIAEGLPDEEISRVVVNDPSILMVVAGRQGVAIEKHSHLRIRRTSGHVTARLSELLKVPLMVVPPDIAMSHISPFMAADLSAQASNEP